MSKFNQSIIAALKGDPQADKLFHEFVAEDMTDSDSLEYHEIEQAHQLGRQTFIVGDDMVLISANKQKQKAYELGYEEARDADYEPLIKVSPGGRGIYVLSPKDMKKALIARGSEPELVAAFLNSINFKTLRPGEVELFDLDAQAFFNLSKPIVAVMLGTLSKRMYWVLGTHDSIVANESLVDDPDSEKDAAWNKGYDDYVNGVEYEPSNPYYWFSGYDDAYNGDVRPLKDKHGIVVSSDDKYPGCEFESFMVSRGADPEMLQAFIDQIDEPSKHGVVKELDPDIQDFFGLPFPVIAVMRGAHTNRIFWLVRT